MLVRNHRWLSGRPLFERFVCRTRTALQTPTRAPSKCTCAQALTTTSTPDTSMTSSWVLASPPEPTQSPMLHRAATWACRATSQPSPRQPSRASSPASPTGAVAGLARATRLKVCSSGSAVLKTARSSGRAIHQALHSTVAMPTGQPANRMPVLNGCR